MWGTNSMSVYRFSTIFFLQLLNILYYDCTVEIQLINAEWYIQKNHYSTTATVINDSGNGHLELMINISIDDKATRWKLNEKLHNEIIRLSWYKPTNQS